MVGLTRFLFLMNLCEKSGVSSNVYKGFCPLKKHANFRATKKLFVLQAERARFQMVAEIALRFPRLSRPRRDDCLGHYKIRRMADFRLVSGGHAGVQVLSVTITNRFGPAKILPCVYLDESSQKCLLRRELFYIR
jgi:hypothetical protein